MQSSKAENVQREKIIERMRDILQAWVSQADPVRQINEGTNLISDLGMDSIGILQTILAIEKEFGITIENSELESSTFSTLGSLIGVIESKLYENN